MGWLSGWNYRKSITVSRASGAVTNYQMKLLVGESSGATGEDVDCGAGGVSKCQSDFDDLRFTTSDGVTLLDYWIELTTGTTPNQLATIWIEFDSIGTGATTFYMYYGNALAVATSNGFNTFAIFDDFASGSLDAAKWGNSGVGTWTVSSGQLHGIGNPAFYLWCKVGHPKPCRIFVKGKSTVFYPCNIWAYSGGTGDPYLSTYISADMDTRDNYGVWNLGSWYKSGAVTVNVGTWYIMEALFSGTAVTVYGFDTNRTALALASYTKTGLGAPLGDKFAFRPYAETQDTEYIACGKYETTEPVWGTWGTEESIPKHGFINFQNPGII